MSDPLNGKQKSYLRGLAHGLSPIVMIGKEGVTPEVALAVDRALADHELIKVRVLETSPLNRHESAEALVDALPKTVIAGELGRIVILYRRHPEKPVIKLPRSKD